MRGVFLRWLVLFAILCGAAGSSCTPKKDHVSQKADEKTPPLADISDKVPPERIGPGVVRVWNASAPPRAERDSIQEARIGQRVIVEIKDLEGWLAKEIDGESALAEPELRKADQDVQDLVVAHHFEASMRAGPWLAAHRPISVSGWDGQMLDDDAVALCATLKNAMNAQKDAVGDTPLPSGWEASGFATYDVAQPDGARKMLLACEKAWKFGQALADTRSKELQLRILWAKQSIDLPPGKLVPDARTDRTANAERYRKISFLLESPRLTDALKESFSLPAKVTVALPEKGKEPGREMQTSVDPLAADPRCRFHVLAADQLKDEKPEKNAVFVKSQQVYPVGESALGRKIKKAEVIEVLSSKGKETTYRVHFLQVGGTREYPGSELRRLPPDVIPIGIQRVWNEDDPDKLAQNAQSTEVPKAAPGERLVVEVRNFDGWLMRQLDLGAFREEASTKALETVRQFLAHKQFSAAVRANVWLREARQDKPAITNADLVQTFKAQARKDEKLEVLLADGLLAPATVSEEDAQKFVAACLEAHTLLLDLQKSKIRELDLNIDGVALGVTPDNADFTPIGSARRPKGDPNEDTYNWLSFHLVPKPEKVDETTGKIADDPWARLLARPSFRMPSRVTLSLSSGGETVVMPTAVTKDAEDPRCRFDLIGIDAPRFAAMLAVFVVILGSLGYFAMRTDMLRDPSQRCPDGLEPVSLARTQMAFWFVVIALAFAFLWVVTGRIGTINSTCLTLLGIGTATALSSVAIERSRQQRCRTLAEVFDCTTHEMLGLPVREIEQMIRARQAELAPQLAAAPAGSPAREELEQTAQLLRDEARKVEAFRARWHWFSKPWAINFTYRFHLGLKDLLSENPGTSAYDFHRFQMLAWTLVLGFVFVAKVLSERTMPEFETNLLLLMGISSGAYLGLKLATAPPAATDKPKEEEPPPAAPPAP